MNLNHFFNELKRRNVIRETIAYILVAWVILQVATILLPIFEAPDWMLKALAVVLIACIPLVVIVSWLYELTSKGLKKASSKNGLEQTKQYSKRLNIIIGISMILVIVMFITIGHKVKELSEVHPHSIAILPFNNLSSDESNQFFIDGIREEIWNRLVKIEEIDPRSNRSADMYNQSSKMLSDIAKELKVKFLLDANLTKVAERIILELKLWDQDEKLIWQKTYNKAIDNLFKMQKLLARDVVYAMGYKIGENEGKIFDRTETDNIDAYLLVKKGEELVVNNRPYEAIPLFNNALQLDPNYANALAGLSHAYTTLSWHYDDTHLQDVEFSKKYAAKAFEIDPENSKALMSLATLYEVVFNNTARAKQYHEKAIKHRPNDPVINFEYGMTLYFSSPQELQKSLKCLKKAFDIEPTNWKYGRELAFHYALLGQYTEAEEIIEAVAPFHPGLIAFRDVNIAEINVHRFGNRKAQLDLYKKRIVSDSLNPIWYTRLAIYYDWYENDDKNFVKYTKMAYELDSTRIIHYLGALIENYEFDKAENLFNGKNFRNQSSSRQASMRFNFLYAKEDMKGLKFMMDTIDEKRISPTNKLLYQVKAGLINEPKDIAPLLLRQLNFGDKATIYAAMGHRDSLYAYLNHPAIESFLRVNSRHAFDPYRDEAEYKAFQEKYFLKSTPLPD